MELAKRLRMKRKALGLSVDAFAAKVGCSQGLVSQWENGMLPANLNKGAIARAKRILKVRVSGKRKKAKILTAKPPKAFPGRTRLTDTQKIFRVLSDIQLRIRKLEVGMYKLNAKPAKVILPDNGGSMSLAQPNPESLAA